MNFIILTSRLKNSYKSERLIIHSKHLPKDIKTILSPLKNEEGVVNPDSLAIKNTRYSKIENFHNIILRNRSGTRIMKC
jgi:hypothetical protein